MGYKECPESPNDNQPRNTIYPKPGAHSYSNTIYAPSFEEEPSAPTYPIAPIYPSTAIPEYKSQIPTVVIHQPVRSEEYQGGKWTSSFCSDSCSELSDCFLAYLCPHLYACILAKDMGESDCSACCQFCFYPFCLCCLRYKARGKHGIEGGLCCDILATQCCPCKYFQRTFEVFFT